ncbi:MAG: plasmid encoded RepA protein [bacterium]|nr:plasmid encoded RepA protein [bacterium]
MKKNQNKTIINEIDSDIVGLFAAENLINEQKKVLAYIPSFFTTASLPLKNLNKPVFIRKGSNGVTLILTSPKNVPFGRYGRLLLSVLTTHAVLSKEKDSPVLIEYNNLSDLLNELQLPRQRGKDIKEQLDCFSSCSFTFEQRIKEVKPGVYFKELYEGNAPQEEVEVITQTTGNIRFTNGIQFKELKSGKDAGRVGYFKILLSSEFAGFCQRHAVPIDYTAYKNISSPVGKDIYAWLVYRNNGLKAPVFIPREKLVEQFMPLSDNAQKDKGKMESNNFYVIVDLIKELKAKYYPELKVRFDEGGIGITLFKSPTPVLKDDVRYALITANI